jgi:hypothetical protein
MSCVNAPFSGETRAEAKIKIGGRSHDFQTADEATERGMLFMEGAAIGARFKMCACAPAQSTRLVQLFYLNATYFAVHLLQLSL